MTSLLGHVMCSVPPTQASTTWTKFEDENSEELEGHVFAPVCVCVCVCVCACVCVCVCVRVCTRAYV